MRQLSMAGVPRYPTYRTRRSGLSAKTDGAPAAGVSPPGTSLPVAASMPKLAILSSSCRPTYTTSGMGASQGLDDRRRGLIIYDSSWRLDATPDVSSCSRSCSKELTHRPDPQHTATAHV